MTRYGRGAVLVTDVGVKLLIIHTHTLVIAPFTLWAQDLMALPPTYVPLQGEPRFQCPRRASKSRVPLYQNSQRCILTVDTRQPIFNFLNVILCSILCHFILMYVPDSPLQGTPYTTVITQRSTLTICNRYLQVDGCGDYDTILHFSMQMYCNHKCGPKVFVHDHPPALSSSFI